MIKVETPGDTAENRQYLTFNLAGEHFAVATLSVEEIIEASSPAAPVIDLGRRIGIVILEVEHSDEKQVIGGLVNAVNEPEPAAHPRRRHDRCLRDGPIG